MYVGNKTKPLSHRWWSESSFLAHVCEVYMEFIRSRNEGNWHVEHVAIMISFMLYLKYRFELICKGPKEQSRLVVPFLYCSGIVGRGPQC